MTRNVNATEVIAFEASGARASVSVATRWLLRHVTEQLPIGWCLCRPSGGDRRFGLDVESDGRYAVLVDGGVVFRDAALGPALDTLRGRLFKHVLFHSRSLLFVHAGAIGHRGRALLLPGPSGTGKSTLVAALIRAGAAYYADDYVPLDRDGRVHPYPRPLWLRDADWNGAEHSIDSLGATAGEGALPVGVVASVAYRHGARWGYRPRTRGEGTLMLMEAALGIHGRPALALTATRGAAAHAAVLAGERGDVDEAAAALLEITEETGVAPAEER